MSISGLFLLIFLSMLFSAGIQWRYIAIAGAALVIAAPLAWLYLMSNDQKLRILALFIPDLDTNGILYQQYNAKIAIGSGGGFGEGLFIGEHVYVPEIHNDFIFSLLNDFQIVATPGVVFGQAGEGYMRFTGFSSYDETLTALERIKNQF